MKILLTFFLMITSLTGFAQISSVTTGDSIEASKLNELISEINLMKSKIAVLEINVMPVGSIVSSILSVAQYQAANGDCWKLADGSAMNVSDELKTITGFNNIPDALTNGTFLRQAKSGRGLGSFEDEAFLSHTHIQDSHNHAQNAHTHAQNAHNHHSGQGYIDATGGQYGAVGGGGNQRYSNMSAGNPVARWNTSSTTATNQDSTATNQSSIATNQNSGGTETRPKNIAVNMFIKVKKNCTLP